ncbi:MAG TPA: DUF4392 domain-containing protein, partial [Clostridia bacterium]|nr:DUF4392 domain-containing protein [Clostridia bacterium]
KMGAPLTYKAAKGILEAITEKGSKVIIGTGFLIAPSFKPETDGPIAAALLARALDLLGAKPIIVAEEGALSSIKAAALAAELNVYDDIEKSEVVPHSVAVIAYPAEKAAAKKMSDYIINQVKPKAMVSIEHPGQGENGKYFTAFGRQLLDWVAPIDELLRDLRKAGAFTVGIGDLGNEAGLGNAQPEILEAIPYADIGVATVIESDAPIMANISEVGTYGLIAALSVVSGNLVLHDARIQEITTRAAVAGGAVEGVGGNPKACIDLIDIKYINYVIELLHCIMIYGEIHSKTRPYCIDFMQKKDGNRFSLN